METVAVEKDLYFWSVLQISLASYLGGPVAGCYLLGRNYKTLGYPSYSKRCYFGGIVGAFVLFTALFLLPEEWLDSVPRYLIPLLYTLFVTSIAYSWQKEIIAKKLEEGSKRYSYFWWLLVVLSIAIIQIPLIVLYSFLFS